MREKPESFWEGQPRTALREETLRNPISSWWKGSLIGALWGGKVKDWWGKNLLIRDWWGGLQPWGKWVYPVLALCAIVAIIGLVAGFVPFLPGAVLIAVAVIAMPGHFTPVILKNIYDGLKLFPDLLPFYGRDGRFRFASAFVRVIFMAGSMYLALHFVIPLLLGAIVVSTPVVGVALLYMIKILITVSLGMLGSKVAGAIMDIPLNKIRFTGGAADSKSTDDSKRLDSEAARFKHESVPAEGSAHLLSISGAPLDCTVSQRNSLFDVSESASFVLARSGTNPNNLANSSERFLRNHLLPNSSRLLLPESSHSVVFQPRRRSLDEVKSKGESSIPHRRVSFNSV